MVMMRGTGWIPETHDERDLTMTSEPVRRIFQRANLDAAVGAAPPAETLPAAVDLRPYFPPVFNQGQINSCTANTAAALLAYYEKRAFDNLIEPSRMFIYKVSRSLLKETGDNGAFLRTAMESLRAFGAPPETYWPYLPQDFDLEPPAFCYALAADYKAITYFKVDRDDDGKAVAGEELLGRVRTQLAHQLPLMFGFALYNSISQANTPEGDIPYPAPGEQSIGLHAIVACGYDDDRTIVNSSTPNDTTVGALLIRNSWGPQWAAGGYAWLPYRYVTEGLTSDWWGLTKAEYLDTRQFGPESA